MIDVSLLIQEIKVADLSSATKMVIMVVMMIMTLMTVAKAVDTNNVFDPCSDSAVKKSDGFTFGIAFSMKESFFFDQIQLSPCDRRLSLSSLDAQLAVFRPKVDEISLLTINTSTIHPVCVCIDINHILCML